MQIRYFDTAWNDIKNSPGWFGKLCLLALANFVPVFGSMVQNGYLYGWAREISWGAHRPMPQNLICNEDGKFWRRGWFAFVLALVFSLIPAIVMTIGRSMQFSGSYSSAYGGDFSAMAIAGGLLYFVGIVGSLFANVLSWIGIMRISIYDRLSAGFQLSKLWSMLRKDTNGILRIFGMSLLIGLIVGILLSIVITALMLIVVFAGMAGAMNAGVPIGSYENLTDAQAIRLFMSIVTSAGIIGILCLLVALFLGGLGTAFANALVARAMGYWTMQFDVPRWRGQDEPMPFELEQQLSAQAQPYSQANAAQPAGGQAAGPMAAPFAVPVPQADVIPTADQQPGQTVGLAIDDQPQGQFAQDGLAYVPQEDGNEIVDRAFQSVQDAQDAVSDSPAVQEYDAQIAAWQSEGLAVDEDDLPDGPEASS